MGLRPSKSHGNHLHLEVTFDGVANRLFAQGPLFGIRVRCCTSSETAESTRRMSALVFAY
jgi:hypothetical protein